ncbi:hypothetical protein DK28_0202025 [Peptococcaceae bacterium SCADC1_2_3]|jgi:hypothetical protein|nr:hypothetical protein DK28_0202025 [Peptococcaceae bacterium SCADC1_2_3]KFI35927.1 hypothetical protein HY00_10725 [Peptococcaceae bacterium SCADC1_2_3]
MVFKKIFALLVISMVLLSGCTLSNFANQKNNIKQKSSLVNKCSNFTENDFMELYPAWNLIKKENICFDDNNYVVVYRAQVNETSSPIDGKIIISVCKFSKERWYEVWYSSEFLTRNTVNELRGYPPKGNDLLIIKDKEIALVAVNMCAPFGGAHGTTQVLIFTLEKTGKCTIRHFDSAGIMSIEKKDSCIIVTGESEYGQHNFCLKNKGFTEETIPLSSTILANSKDFVIAKFIVGPEGIVYPAESKDIVLKVGQAIVFVPLNKETKNLFDTGEIGLYCDEWNGPPLTVCEANRIKTGNSYTFDKPGLVHFLLISYDAYFNNQEFSPEYNPEHTFNVMVKSN